jgi:hypothetical protein
MTEVPRNPEANQLVNKPRACGANSGTPAFMRNAGAMQLVNKPRSSDAGILRPPNGHVVFNKLAARSRGTTEVRTQHSAESSAANAGPAAVTGHRLVRFERRRDPRSNTGPRDAGNATVQEQAMAGETAKPGQTC